MPLDWFGLNFNSVFFTKVFWNYATHIVRVCVSPLGPINPQLHVSKSSLPVKLGSRAMASLYEILCHHSLTNTDLMNYFLISVLDFLHIYLTISHKNVVIMNKSDELTLQFLQFVPMIRPTFLNFFNITSIFNYTSDFYHKDGLRTVKKDAEG